MQNANAAWRRWSK